VSNTQTLLPAENVYDSL